MIEQIFKDTLAENNIDPSLHPLVIRAKHSGIVLETPGHPSLGRGPIQEHAGSASLHASAAKRLAFRIINAVRRERAIATAGCDPANPPPWAYRIQPVLGLLLTRHIGLSPEEIVTPSNLPAANHLIVNNHSIATVRGSSIKTSVGQIYLHGENITNQWLVLRHFCTLATESSLRILIHMDATQIPETLMMGMAGKRLSQIVAHPAIEGTPEIIKSAKIQATSLRLDIDRRWARLDAIPEGVDDSWTKTRRTLDHVLRK